MNLNNTKKGTSSLKKTMVGVAVLSALGFAHTIAFANNGKLTVINSLAHRTTDGPGSSASSFKVVVNDSTGPCSTIASVLYGASTTVSWDDTKTHSTTVCTGITSVDITPLATSTGTVQYDSTANATPPKIATAATSFTAPTAGVENLALIVTGNNSPSTTNSATVWGAALGVSPIYDAGNGSLTTTGIPGGVGSAGYKAAAVMQHYGIEPVQK